LTLDNKISTNVGNTAFVYVTRDIDGANVVSKNIDAAEVDFNAATPGVLKAFTLNVGQISTTAGGHGSAIVDQVFAIGGLGASPNNKVKSGFICPASGCSGTPPPQLGSINDNGGGTLTLQRYLMGSTTEVAHFFMVGGNVTAGDTTAAGQTATTESSIW